MKVENSQEHLSFSTFDYFCKMDRGNTEWSRSFPSSDISELASYMLFLGHLPQTSGQIGPGNVNYIGCNSNHSASLPLKILQSISEILQVFLKNNTSDGNSVHNHKLIIFKGYQRTVISLITTYFVTLHCIWSSIKTFFFFGVLFDTLIKFYHLLVLKRFFFFRTFLLLGKMWHDYKKVLI